FTDNLTPTGIITVKGKTQEEVDIAQAKIDQAAMEGRKRTPRIISDAEWHQITITPADAEFLLARQLSVQDIARMFGLPSYFLSVPQGDPLTYATAESMGRILVTFTLRPTYFQRIEESMSAVLPEGKVARFNANELLRADIKARYDSYVAGLGAK